MSEDRHEVKRAEVLGGFLLVAAVAQLLSVSWRRWADPLIDFGRELYLPWQINQGTVLYRDIDANYGPLSHYFNALVFRVFGTGFMQLAWTNLTIYFCILGLLYRVLRLVWGPTLALVGSLTFVGFFSFNQLGGVGNYNFVAPYAHETTHGFLALLAIIWGWGAWLRRPSVFKSALLGLLFGTTLLLKLEIIFTAGAIFFVALVLVALSKAEPRGGRPGHAAAMLLSAAVPPATASLVLFETGRFSISQAVLWANVGWTGLVLFPGIAQDPFQATLLGTNAILENLQRLAFAGFASMLALCLLAWVSERLGRAKKAFYVLGSLLLGIVTLFLSIRLPWIDVATVFPAGLLSLALVWIHDARRSAGGPVGLPRAVGWLLWAAGLALLARMALSPRIYHYGYCQAALAGVLTVATLWGELPRALGLRGRALSSYLFTLSLILLSGLWTVQSISQRSYSFKTQPVGEGADRFYAYTPELEPTGFLVEDSRKALAAVPGSESLLVLPEGIMLNYLSRRPTPSHVYTFNPYWLRWTDSVLADLKKRPPPFVLVISRDMTEYGIQRFGESPEHGGPILAWVAANYALTRRVGDDALDRSQRGTMILQPRDSVLGPAQEPAH